MRRMFNKDMFTDDIKLTSPSGSEYTVKGLGTVISMPLDIDGTNRRIAVGERATITFIEKDVTDLGPVVRDNSGVLDMGDWHVEFETATGLYCGYMDEPLPDTGLGYVMYNLTRKAPPALSEEPISREDDYEPGED